MSEPITSLRSKPLSQQRQADITIVGGGMVGASLALLLNSLDLGWQIKVIEAFPVSTPLIDRLSVHKVQDSFDARSTALSHSSRQIFELLGLWEILMEGTSAIQQVHVSDRGHLGSARLKAVEQKLPALGYVTENQWLGTVLMTALQQADDVEVIAPARVSSVCPVSGGVQLSLAAMKNTDHTAAVDDMGMATKLLVIADGAQSQTRSMLGIDATVKEYGQVAVVTNVSLDQHHSHIAYERFTGLGSMALLPLQPMGNEHRAALIWILSPERAAELMAATDTAFLAELQTKFGYRLGVFLRVGVRQNYPVKLVTSNEQIRSNVVVMGNAAHALHPIAGQGFNLALRDIAMLANTLANAADNGTELGDLSVLQDYLEQQRSDQEQTILLSDLLPKIFGINAVPIELARNLGLLTLDAVPLFRHQFTRLGMGLETRGITLKPTTLSPRFGNAHD